jgi:hypothetical protein
MVHNVIEDGGKKIIESFIAEDSSIHSVSFERKSWARDRDFR